MEPSHDFKIIIAGGGIAGLTLAVLLEKFDIDFVLLEAHDEIAPPVGASIGMMPNGLLILDQLGCYDAVRAVSRAGETDRITIRDSNGQPMAVNENVLDHLEHRHGYPVIFFDRQWLLQVLFEKIQHKDRILLRNRVKTIETGANGVQVSTQDGQTHHGTMIIGADGIYSAVRSEMLRIAGETNPEYFPTGEEDGVPCYYQCSFGIAHKVAGWPQHEQNFTTGDKRAFLVCSGPEDRVFWFLFVKLPEAKYGRDIPRYTKEDEAVFVKKHQSLLITETLTFGDVFAKRITSTLTPLHQVVFEKWYFNRMLLIGDSAHKPHPASGMGANAAIETVAEFVNALIAKRDARPDGLNGLTTEDVNAICHKTQSVRHRRAKVTISASEKMQAVLAFENPIVSTIAWRIYDPLTGKDSLLRILGGRTLGGSRVDMLPIPSRPRAVPYHHELPARPVKSSRAILVRLLYTAVMGLLFFLSLRSSPGSSCLVGGCQAVESSKSSGLSFLQQPTFSTAALPRLGLIYLLSQSISPLLIYTIEGSRAGSQDTPSALSFPYTIGLQVMGICRATPLLSILTGSLPFDAPAGRYVELEVAKSLVPALTFGYIFPRLLMLAPLANNGLSEWVNASWMMPLLFPALTTLFCHAFRLIRTKSKKPHLNQYTLADIPILQVAYGFAFATQGTAHLAALAYTYSYINMRSTAVLDFESRGILSVLTSVMSSEVVLTVIAITVHNLYSVWDLRRAGYIATRSSFAASLCVTLSQVIAGPGATWAGLWSWREGVISGLSTLR
ncbi:FAD binding domain protein [Dactylonectria estremocensis]|uniref:FAD binding domain protein n=1 Tax=Dactylonectria estremocensis TaxID=1079267 RepID=A0A9P9EUG3_9HYPO|nr:FAD binding domain protein [Dactylonectria estremocensis]